VIARGPDAARPRCPGRRIVQQFDVMRRVAIICGAAAAALVGAAPAAAHTLHIKLPGGGTFSSTVTSLTPAVPGLSVSILDSDDQIVVRNRTGRTLTALGYQGEPYMRFIPGKGVFENLNSPATYDNTVRLGTPKVPSFARKDAKPRWFRVGLGDSWSWHDHRIHWMSTIPPAAVVAHPGQKQRVFGWSVALDAAGRPVKVDGSLEFIPGGGAGGGGRVLLIALGAGAVTVTLGAGLMIGRSRRRSRSGSRVATPPRTGPAS